MAVELSCSQCQAVLRIAEENLGKKSRCPNCQHVFIASEHSDSSLASEEGSLSREDALVASSKEVDQGLLSGEESAEDRFSPLHDPLLGEDVAGDHSPVEEHNPYAPASAVFSEPNAEVGEICPTVIAIDTVIESSWVLFKHFWAMAVVTVIIVAGVNYGVGFIQNLLSIAVGAMPGIDPVIQVGVQFFLAALAWLVGFWVQLGQSLVMLDICRGKGVDFARVFSAGSSMLSAVGAMLVVVCLLGLLVALFVGLPVAVALTFGQEPDVIMLVGLIGVGLGLIPFIILSIRLSMTQLLVIDQRCGPWDAIAISWRITQDNKMTLFLLLLVVSAISVIAFIVGLLACILGLIPTMLAVGAFVPLVYAVTYLNLTGQITVLPEVQAVRA
ncbi:MAG: zinc-ribbon domain-containing protein [Rubripirellula sp.]|nr:zinc-ribbon domain-containing protein [Rubripirellula sp.]